MFYNNELKLINIPDEFKKIILEKYFNEFKTWTEEEDQEAAVIITDALRRGCFLADGFTEAGRALHRSSTCVDSRWGHILSKKFKHMIPKEEDIPYRQVRTRKKWRDEEDFFLLKMLYAIKDETKWGIVWDEVGEQLSRTPKSVKSRWANTLSKATDPFAVVREEMEPEETNKEPDLILAEPITLEASQSVGTNLTFTDLFTAANKPVDAPESLAEQIARIEQENRQMKQDLEQMKKEKADLLAENEELKKEVKRKRIAINEMLKEKKNSRVRGG